MGLTTHCTLSETAGTNSPAQTGYYARALDYTAGGKSRDGRYIITSFLSIGPPGPPCDSNNQMRVTQIQLAGDNRPQRTIPFSKQ